MCCVASYSMLIPISQVPDQYHTQASRYLVGSRIKHVAMFLSIDRDAQHTSTDAAHEVSRSVDDHDWQMHKYQSLHNIASGKSHQKLRFLCELQVCATSSTVRARLPAIYCYLPNVDGMYSYLVVAKALHKLTRTSASASIIDCSFGINTTHVQLGIMHTQLEETR